MRPIARRVGNAREVRSGCRAGPWPSARAASGCGLCLAVLFLPRTDGRSGSPAGPALSISLASPRPTATGAGTSGNEPGSWHPAGRSIAESAAPGEHPRETARVRPCPAPAFRCGHRPACPGSGCPGLPRSAKATDSRGSLPGLGVLQAASHERMRPSATRTLSFIPSAVHWISSDVPERGRHDCISWRCRRCV